MKTIKDVAELANVSIATVSRALNGRGYVSEKTRSSIMNAVAELNYVPNQVARDLFASEKKTIGYVIPTVCHPFFAQVTQHIEQYLYEAGYRMMLFTTVGDKNRESQIIDILCQHRVDAIIIGSCAINTTKYSDANIPIIAFDTQLDCADVSISSNHRLGGEMVADRVLKSGCHSVLQVIGDPEARTFAKSRHQVFFDRMTKAGVTCISIPIPDNSDLDIASYPALVDHLVQTYPGVDTYFATDLLAVEILKASLKYGKSIPDDIQIIGYDGSFASRMSYPPITTLCQPIPELAREIVDSLCALLHGKKVKNSIILDNLFFQEGMTMR